MVGKYIIVVIQSDLMKYLNVLSNTRQALVGSIFFLLKKYFSKTKHAKKLRSGQHQKKLILDVLYMEVVEFGVNESGLNLKRKIVIVSD